MKKAGKNKHKQSNSLTASGKYRPVAVLGVVATLIIGLGIAAYAANNLLHGHVRFTEHRNQTAPVDTVTKGADESASPKQAASSSKAVLIPNLVEKYGTAAASPTVAAAIRMAEEANGTKGVDRQTWMKSKSDAYGSLRHGVWKPGADPMVAIMHGYVPPGMSQQQAAMLYSALPKNARIPTGPQPMTPERIAAMAGEPADPMMGLPDGLSHEGVQAANQKMFEGYIRERFGPVYVPPLHRDHNAAAQASGTLAVKDNQMSPIEPEYNLDRGGSVTEMTDQSGNVVSQYGYDPYGRQTRIGGTGPDADFGYRGTYVHQRSGLLMMGARAYSPALGRFINRDPLEEAGGINMYAYVENNPISRFDPTGTSYQDLGGGGSMNAPLGTPPPNPIGAKCWDECKGKLPILGPLLVAGGLPVLSTGGKFGGATAGTSPISAGLRGALGNFGSGAGPFWGPTAGNPFSTTPSLGGALGRWAPIIGAGLTAKEYNDWMCCIQNCIKRNSGGGK
jgi:RHS repeat-associated protein